MLITNKIFPFVGIANFEADEGFNKENDQNHINAANSGRYGEISANKQDNVNQNQFNKGTFYQSGGGDVTDHELKSQHKKGHHKTGFHNSYHKDEQGSNSSFYDDGSDEGGDYAKKSHNGKKDISFRTSVYFIRECRRKEIKYG